MGSVEKKLNKHQWLEAWGIPESDEAPLPDDQVLARLKFWSQSQNFWGDRVKTEKKPETGAECLLPGDQALLQMRRRNVSNGTRLALCGQQTLKLALPATNSTKNAEVYESQSMRVRSKLDQLMGKVRADAADLRERLDDMLYSQNTVKPATSLG